MIKYLSVLFFFTIPIFSFAKEQILTGTLIGAGLYIETDTTTIPIKHSELQKELSELVGKKIRILCILDEDTCLPQRYEIAPFLNEKNLEKWTLKKIPKYVYLGMNSFNPKVTPDGNTLYWTVATETGLGSTQKIWYSEMDKQGFWKKGMIMEAPLNNKAPSAVIEPLPGGNILFVFGSFADEVALQEAQKTFEMEKNEILKNSKSPKEYEGRYIAILERYKREKEKILNKVPLYKTFKKTNGWSNPEPIAFPDFYNLYKSEENPLLQVFGGCTLSSNGKVLIYSAKHKDAIGKLDIYVSEENASGIFPVGTNLGTSINTETEDMAPFLASDDKTLYFSTYTKKGLNVFLTQRIGDSWTNWTKPQEISTNLKGVNYFSIPASGNWAYISRAGALEMTFLPNEVKPDPVIIVKGKIKTDKGVPLAAEIFYESLTTKANKGSTISDPNTGDYTIVLPYGDNYGFHATKEGHLPFHQNKDLREIEKQYKEIEVDMTLPKLEKGGEIVINNLFFESNRAEIKKESEAELDRLGEVMKVNKNMEVVIEGHTDNVGKNADNIALSLARANSVADYIIQKFSIDKSRLKVDGRGEDAPISDNNSADTRAKNRRVVFKILKN
jgi:outer membrane protein OmpA-like peptidoglycan-associated protein